MFNQNKIYNSLKENVFDKKILIEKYYEKNKEVDYVLLTDFESETWEMKNVDMPSVIESVSSFKNRLKEGIIYGDLIEKNSDYNFTLKNQTFRIKNIYLKNKKIYGDIEFLDMTKAILLKELLNKNLCTFNLIAFSWCNDDCSYNPWVSEDERTVFTDILTWDLMIKE